MMNNNFLLEGTVYTKLMLTMTKHSPYMSPFYFYLHRRARHKYNLQGTIGEGGSGKSYWAILTALILDPTFTNDRIIYSTINFLDQLDELEDRTMKGRVIVWDDAGVGLPSSEWYSLSNKVVQLTMQTVRTLHPTIIFTTPDSSYLDPKTRNALTSLIDVSSKKQGQSSMRIYTLKRLRLLGEVRHRRFVFRAGMAKTKLGQVKLKHPPMEVLPEVFHDYEKVQQKFKFKSRKKFRELLEAGKGLQKKSTETGLDDFTTLSLSDMEKRAVYDIYVRVYNDPTRFVYKNGKLNKRELMLRHKVSSKIAKSVKRYYDKKMLPEHVKEELDES